MEFFKVAFFLACVGIPAAIMNLIVGGPTTFEWILLIMQIPCFSVGLNEYLTSEDEEA